MQKELSVLGCLNASLYVLYMKTYAYHWNVNGKNFLTLHNLFEEQYRSLLKNINNVAEKIAILKSNPIVNINDILSLSLIKESDTVISSNLMLQTLSDDNKIIVEYLSNAISNISCQATIDFLIHLLEYHNKVIWLLESSIDI